MRNSSRKAIERPIIKKCTLLYEMILDGKKKAPRDIQHSILNSTIETAHRLYIQAFRQARGKDYLKRAIETLEEIQADIYLVMLMHGWSKEFCAKLDVMCDDIEQCLYASANANAQEGQNR